MATTTSAQRNRLSVDSGRPTPDAVRAQTKKISSKQAENLQERLATTLRIADRFDSEAKARGRASGWRQATIDALLSLSLGQLQRVEQQATSVDGLPGMIGEAASDPNLFGDPDSDLVYTPITPCRFSDTRIVAGKILGSRGYDMDSNGALYGGSAACDPIAIFGVANADELPAVAMNVTLIDTTVAPGFVAVKPNPGAPISSLVNWYEVGEFVQNSNFGIVTLEQDLANPDEFVVQTPAAVHVILDLFGVFLPPEATSLEQTFPTASVDIANGQFGFVITPACPVGFSITGGQCGSSVTKPELTDSKIESGGWYCGGRNTGGGTLTLVATAICSRVPGR